MTTSVTWTLSIGEAVTRAYRRLGVLTPPYVPSADQMTQGLIEANATLKAMQTAGINVFRQTQISLTTTPGQNTVAISPYIAGIEDCRLVVTPAPNLYERLLGRYTYSDYMSLPNKLAQGSPTVWMFDRQVSTTQLYISRIPITPMMLNCTVARTATDMLMPSDPIDLPSEWVEGYIYILADAFMDDFGVAAADQATAQRISGHAQYWKQRLEDFDRPTSVFVRPWGRGARSKIWR
jgi:hypothetical protein